MVCNGLGAGGRVLRGRMGHVRGHIHALHERKQFQKPGVLTLSMPGLKNKAAHILDPSILHTNSKHQKLFMQRLNSNIFLFANSFINYM